MATRSIGQLSLSFGLVSIPVKVFPATETKDAIRFNFLHKDCGSRVKQQYLCIREQIVIERSDMIKGYEFAPDQYVMFTSEELKALEDESTHTIDIVAFVPESSIDPIYYDKAYYLAPDKRGDRPYSLLLEGMKQTGRHALARWTWRGKSYTVQVRPSQEGGLVLQQLLYADEVRSMKDLDLPDIDVKKTELDLAVMLIEQTAQDAFNPAQYSDEEKQRIEEVIEQKIAGKEIAVSEEPAKEGGKVIDLMEALRASLAKKGKGTPAAKSAAAPTTRKSARRTEEEEHNQAATGTHGKTRPAKPPAPKKTKPKPSR
jgi:DNA end-binding protein Ku